MVLGGGVFGDNVREEILHRKGGAEGLHRYNLRRKGYALGSRTMQEEHYKQLARRRVK